MYLSYKTFRKIIVTIFFVLCPIISQAFLNSDIIAITMREGLPDNTVLSIHKDKDGFMWFGTANGLSRYDGVSFSNFNSKESFESIYSIFQMPNRILLLQEGAHLRAFNMERECYIPIEWSHNSIPDELDNPCFQNDSTFWFVSKGKVYKTIIRPVMEQGIITSCTAEAFGPFDTGLASGLYVTQVCCSPAGELIMAAYNGTLVISDTDGCSNQRIIKFETKANLGINKVFADKGYVWIGTNARGLYLYNRLTDNVEHYQFSNSPLSPLPHTDVYDIVTLPGNRGYFLATWSGYAWFKPKGDGTHFETATYDGVTSQLHENLEMRFLCAYCDSEGNLWAGTRGGGVLLFNAKESYSHKISIQKHNVICTMIQDDSKHIWAATFHNGIMRSTDKYDNQESVDMETLYGGNGVNICYSAVKDNDGMLYFGTDKGRIVAFNPDNLTHTTFELNNDNPDIWALILDDNNTMWAGTSNGLYIIDRQSRKSELILPSIFIYAIAVQKGVLWLAASDGVVRFDTYKNTVQRFDELKYMTRSAAIARAVFVSSMGDLYAGYQNGLGIIEQGSDTLSAFYTTRDGLCNNFVGCITEDSSNQIWIGSNSGVSMFNKKTNLFHNLYISGNNRSVLNVGEQILWGNNKSIVSLNPKLVKSGYSLHNKVYFTNLEINNESITTGEERNGQVILNKSITYSDKIVLSPRNYKFSVHFNNFSYSQDDNTFMFRLSPYEKRWRTTDEKVRVSYAHLPNGEYLLEARTMSPDGVLGEISSLKVKILPKWTETAWFFIGCILLLLTCIYLIEHYLDRNRIRKERENNLKQEVLKVNLERSKERQIHDERSNFFTGMSHELRTPLTLIIAPLQEILGNENQCNVSEEVKERLLLINKNASLLSNSVDQILYLQKMEAGMVTLHYVKSDIVLIVKEIVASFADLIRIKHLTLHTEYQSNEIFAEIDQDKITFAIRNVLSNAIKYTPERGTVKVSVAVGESLGIDCFRVSISDNGPGIKKEDQEHIFDSFITTVNIPTVSNKMGIGLKTVKQTIDLHHGKIDLISEEDKGCTFILNIPLHPSPYPLKDEETPSSDRTAKDTESLPKQKSLLIIEDNIDIQSYLETLFKSQFTIHQAFNGEWGVAKSIESMPDAIICDVMMPVMDGFECCEKIRSNPATSPIPILMLTAKAEDADLIKGLHAGADDYLMKPFNPNILKAKVHNLIRQREELKKIYNRSLFKDPTHGERPNQDDNLFTNSLIHFVEQHISDSSFSVENLANYMNMSQRTLLRKIKKETGLSGTEIIRDIRLGKAASLLMQQRFTIQEVSEMVGYNDQATFRAHFKSKFGVVPSKFAENSF